MGKVKLQVNYKWQVGNTKTVFRIRKRCELNYLA